MVGPSALALIEKRLAVSADEEAQPAAMGARVDDVDRRRASLNGRPKLRLALDPVPDDGQCIRFDEGTYRTVTGADRFDEAVVFQDSIDRLMDVRVGAGADVVKWLAGLAGYPDAQFKQIVDQLGPGSVTTVLEPQWAAVTSAQ